MNHDLYSLGILDSVHKSIIPSLAAHHMTGKVFQSSRYKYSLLFKLNKLGTNF